MPHLPLRVERRVRHGVSLVLLHLTCVVATRPAMLKRIPFPPRNPLGTLIHPPSVSRRTKRVRHRRVIRSSRHQALRTEQLRYRRISISESLPPHPRSPPFRKAARFYASRCVPKRIHASHRPRRRQIILFRTRNLERRQQSRKSKLLLTHLDDRRMKPITLRGLDHHAIRRNPSAKNLNRVSHATCLLKLRPLMLSEIELLIDRLPQLPARAVQAPRHTSHKQHLLSLQLDPRKRPIVWAFGERSALYLREGR